LSGYALILASKPLLIFFPTAGPTILARLFERIGSGLQTTPIDVWVSDITSLHQRGAAYALKRSVTTLGAFVGGGCASFLLWYSGQSYLWVFAGSLLPAMIATAIMLALRDPDLSQEAAETKGFETTLAPWWPWQQWHAFPPLYRRLLWVIALVAMSRTLEPFLIMMGRHYYHLSLPAISTVYAVMYGTYALIALAVAPYLRPSNGWRILGFGLTIFLLLQMVACWHPAHPVFFWLMVMAWGAYLGLIQPAVSTMISAMIAPRMLGAAFGLYHLAHALPMIVSGGVAGWIVDRGGLEAIFVVGSGCTALGLVWFLGLVARSRPNL
jgi:MFS family permease